MPEELISQKTQRGAPAQLVRAILAGAYIALGAQLMLTCREQGMPPLVCGIAFSLGLWATMCACGELFTGDCLMLADLNGKDRARDAGIWRCLLITYVGNAVGAVTIAGLVAATATALPGAYAMVATKCVAPPSAILAKAILCNVCVALAVGLGCQADTHGERLVCAVMPVTCFVTCGWEHSIADMFLLATTFPAIPAASALTLLAVSTVGNMLGAYLLAGAWKLAGRETDR